MAEEKYDLLLISALRDRMFNNSYTAYGHRCLAAYLRKHSNFSSRVLIGNTQKIEKILRQDVYTGKTNVVGFYAIQDNYPIVKHVVKALHERGITTIIGGPNAMSINEDMMRNIGVDYCISGEGEIALNQLMRYLKLGEGSLESIKGLKYIDENNVFHDGGMAICPQNLDDGGYFPDAWDITQEKEKLLYFTMTGRGCPNQCAFCYEGYERKLRFRSVENVMEEIDEHLREVPETKVIVFLDDTFTLNTDRLRAFCSELKKRNLKWICEIHVAKFYKEPFLFDEMTDAGLVSAQIGIESGSNRVLKAYNKNITAEMLIKVVEYFSREKKVELEGNFILGGAMETRETIEESISLAEKLIEVGKGVISLNVVFYAPYERTMVTSKPQNYEMDIDKYLSGCIVDTMHMCVNSTNALTREEIQNAMAKFRERIASGIRKASCNMTRTELELLYKRDGGFKRISNQWKYHMKTVEHLRIFMKCGFRYHSIFDHDAVPIRSFNDLVYDGDALVVENYRFKGLERRMLEISNGTRTFSEVAQLLEMPLNDVYTLYSSLTEKLMIYMERY